MPTKIITRIFGGIGNQLFCYAAARRLSIVNNAELVIDNVSGFAYDHDYERHYQLNHFNIPCRNATRAERFEPFSRMRRYLKRRINQRRPLEQRQYIQQEGIGFDPRLLEYNPRGTVYLEGYWQSEGYFKDIEQSLREDLRIASPSDAKNLRMNEEILKSNAVAIHVRLFDELSSNFSHNASLAYYHNAIALIEKKIVSPRYFLFSDNTDAARKLLKFPGDNVAYVSHNNGDENAYADLWLMTKCRHFIIANSSFSWWGAWLGETQADTVIITPGMLQGKVTAWGFPGLIPDRWIVIDHH
ncbi:MAG: alpha-1,2-fucosyltransferase [Candidatus Scalindua sp. AMX11]|nr:MAG: alpha-1,2-fucosyltransferase [Candidatus Scalindua sp.]NOG82940.1 alpha-1,2-fucosyltransferase [Planctomycetota bacterium]RZV68757.1 MAG: alpha-1,2-fucosyltransferase [Candidatus Scalindua sp. SCAELEC01]TDE63817.1 MAG: alpha-1,2-fucosyltransferase [Candidatus Scalindua sp. AMX11]